MKSIIFHFVRGSAGSILDCQRVSKICAQSHTLKGNFFAARVWLKRLHQVHWLKRLSTTILDTSRLNVFEDWWISSLVASRASHFLAVGKEKEWKTIDISGRLSKRELNRVDPESCSLKTSMASKTQNHQDITAFCIMSSVTWRDWVIEQQRRGLAREKWGHRIDGEGGLFLEFATPTAKANQLSPSMMKHRGCQAFWITPADQEGHTKRENRSAYINPAWVENLMGFPIGWTECEH